MSCCQPSIGPSPGAVVWFASTVAAGDAAWAHPQARLFGPSETRRLARFARPARVAQFVAAHVAVRHLAAAQLAVAGCAEPPSAYWCDLLGTTGAASAVPLHWRRTTGGAQ